MVLTKPYFFHIVLFIVLRDWKIHVNSLLKKKKFILGMFYIII